MGRRVLATCISPRSGIAVWKEVRKRKYKALRQAGNDTLFRSKYLWLTNPQNIKEKSKDQFNAPKAMALTTARACALKEALRKLWSYQSQAWAIKFWKRWYFWATYSRLAAKLIARHLPNVLTYFMHCITDAIAEGLNSKIATVQKRPCGYCTSTIFKIAVYFHCDGLNLYPADLTHGKVG